MVTGRINCYGRLESRISVGDSTCGCFQYITITLALQVGMGQGFSREPGGRLRPAPQGGRSPSTKQQQSSEPPLTDLSHRNLDAFGSPTIEILNVSG